MYHSLDAPIDETSDFVAGNKRGSRPSLRKSLSGSFYKKLDPQQARERHQRRMLVACEKLLSALLSIDEVHLSLSSKGMCIIHLSIGIPLHFVFSHCHKEKKPCSYGTKEWPGTHFLCMYRTLLCVQTMYYSFHESEVVKTVRFEPGTDGFHQVEV